MQTRYRDVPACVTKDGSLRMQPAVHGNRGQRLAEATGPAYARDDTELLEA